MPLVTSEWKRLIWDDFLKKVLKGIGYFLLVPASLCLLTLAGAVFLSITFLLGALWILSLGHITLIRVWIRILDVEVMKFWKGDVGKFFRKVYFGELNDNSKES